MEEGEIERERERMQLQRTIRHQDEAVRKRVLEREGGREVCGVGNVLEMWASSSGRRRGTSVAINDAMRCDATIPDNSLSPSVKVQKVA